MCVGYGFPFSVRSGGATLSPGVLGNTTSSPPPPTLTSNSMMATTTTMNTDTGNTSSSGAIPISGGTAVNANANNINADVGPGLVKDGNTIAEPEQTHASVSHLLSRGYSLPCSTAAQAFTQLVQPTARFQLALDALLPLLDSYGRSAEVCASFFLFSIHSLIGDG